jgi:hypothetical protein
MVRTQFYQADMARSDTRICAASYARYWLRAGLIVLAAAGLAGCSTAPPPRLPAPVYYSSPTVPNPAKRASPAQPAAPVSATSGTAPSEAAPDATSQTQLPAAAQSPTAVPPPGGMPHDSSEYIEPPAR